LKRFVKALGLAFAVLIVLLIAAGLWLALVFEPNAHRSRIAALVREATGRELAIDGDLRVELFPRLAIGVGPLRLAQPEGLGAPPFARIAGADADVRLLPLLLYGEVGIGRLRLEGLAVELRRRADGTTNWSDLAPRLRQAARESPAPEGGAGDDGADARGAFRIGAMEVDGASVRYVDEQAQREVALRDGSLRTGSVVPGEPFAIETRFLVEQGAFAAELRGRGEATVGTDASFELRDATIDVAMEDAPFGAGALDVQIETPVALYTGTDLRVERPRVKIEGASGSRLQVDAALAADALSLSGGDALAVTAAVFDLAFAGDAVPGGRARLVAQAPALNGSLDEGTLGTEEMNGEVYGVIWRASAAATQLGDAPAIAGRIVVAPFSPRALIERMGYAPAATADPQAFTHAQLEARYAAGAGGLRLHDVQSKVDDTAIAGEVAVTDPARAAVRFDLVADRLVLDRYLAPAAAGRAAATGPGAFMLTSEGLRALDVAGSLRVAELTLAGLRSTDARLEVASGDEAVPAAPVASAPGPQAAALAGLAGD
jgi:AsmA protein